MSTRLECTDLSGGRGSATAFRNVDLTVDAGSVLALLGPNGAGKTTLLLTLAGLLPAQAGTISVDGTRLRNGRPAAANAAGVVLVPDNRALFTTLTVEENIRVAARRNGPKPKSLLETFPALEKRWNLPAGALSGGEQQMLVMARALVQQPQVLLIDELSMGLAPLIVEDLFKTVSAIAADHKCAVILVEQHVNLALEVADSAAVLNRGRIVLRGAAKELAASPELLEGAYLGIHQEEVAATAAS
ncbi:ABC transporter ATP-binding protein [Frankia sp. CcI49]|uniref:ABC transporter ATP-binding protein n=1 Tax=unclassified Frankia TaxID=2632575 RepID=UPI0006C9F5F7|nr:MULTISPECIES: ATP-binding cassette domain-containing protein [unclassified Frankia]KPM54244.1 branched-chain amino acid ABC transporter ATP-binding protein [Frankia sp. R43]ONH61670.1 ABC transporter ATP-binding protein [Frankia sp. CcI49]